MFCIPSPVWDTWSLILHPLRRMQCKHLLIIRVECTLTHNTRNLIKARDGEKTITTVLAPFPVLQAASMMKFTCREIASQQMPKMATFRGVRK